MLISIVIILIFFIPNLNNSLGQLIPNRFGALSVNDGLSSGTVNDILQDKKGFLWFGTEDGLNRFDGYDFKVFNVNLKDSNTISNNYIWSLAEDNHGKIWIGTDGGGLNRYDPVFDKFDNFIKEEKNPETLPGNVVQSLLFDSNNNLWIGTWGAGLCKFDQNNKSFERIKFSDLGEYGNEIKYIWTIFEDSQGKIWIGTDNTGLIQYNPVDEKSKYFKNSDINNSISSNSIVSICEDQNKNLWIGTYGGGLNRLNILSGKFVNYQNRYDWKNTIGDQNIMRVFMDSMGRIWVASMEKGLFYYDKSDDKFINYSANQYNTYSISTNNLRSLYEDNSGVLWIGTLGEGLNKIDVRSNTFYFIKNEINNSNSLSENFIFSILEDSRGDIWFGSYGGGISKFLVDKNEFTHYKHNPNSSLSINSNNVRTIFEDSYNEIWIGTYPGGLNKYVRSGDSFLGYDIGNSEYTLNNGMVRVIFEDRDKNLWIGTKGGGLALLNRQTNRYKFYMHSETDSFTISGNEVLSITEDLKSNLWIGTFGDGLNKFSKQNGKFKRYGNDSNNKSSLSNNIVTELFVSSDGRLWIGTWGGGLNIYDEDSESFSSITTEDGLLNNVICSIVEDDNKNLWISSLRGISKLNMLNGRIKNYDQNDGLLPGEFNPGASERTEDGWIYFGGSKGVNFFHPDSLYDSDFQPQVVLTSFKKHNVESSFGNTIFYTDTIFLAYDEDNFSFEFSAFDYTNPQKINYSYKLENFDEEWINSGSRRYANYTHLNYGEYLFKVRATNSYGVWGENYAQIHLIISPPFWSTWYFRIFIILLIFAIVFYYYKRKKKELDSERRAQEIFTEKLIESQEQERKRIASGLHDSLGQNLLIIKNRALLGLNSPTIDSIKKELEEISNSASVAINEVRHISYNLHPYQLSRLGLTKAIESIINNVESVSEINFTFSINNIDNFVPKNFEINIFRIIQESINNIIKHSQAKNVEVDVAKSNGNISVNIMDDGIGFDIKKVASKGFGLQNMSKRINLLRGKLNIESEIDKGTKVTITIPVGENE